MICNIIVCSSNWQTTEDSKIYLVRANNYVQWKYLECDTRLNINTAIEYEAIIHASEDLLLLIKTYVV